MILRPDYINRIKPFIGLEPVKVLTGLRRSGKSVMLKLIQDEIRHEGVAETNIISFNFESMNTPRDAEALHRENYTKACADAFLFFKINREDLQGKKILTINEKYYVADHGLRRAVYGQANDIEQVLENIVCLELLRRGYKVTVGRNGEKEIDFVATKNGEKLYVQVCYLLADEKTAKREFDAYKGVPDNYPKYVVSLDEISRSRDGIKHLNIPEFLLKDEWS